MYVYIAYRNLPQHFSENAGCGGVPVNRDYRFVNVKDDIYLLIHKGSNYAVSKEDAEKFIQDVLGKCTEKKNGFFPLMQSLNGKETAAVVDIRNDDEPHCHYLMDDEVLYQMLEDLRSGSGEPMDPRQLMNYCYPNPVLPEDDFELNQIYHAVYYKPDNTPVSVIKPYTTDKKESVFETDKGGVRVQIRDGSTKTKYKVPAELIPEIKEKVRILCKDPAEAYVEAGNWEGYIRFGKDNERIFTDPDKTLELLKEIASKSVFESKEEVVISDPGAVMQPSGGMIGVGMMGMFKGLNLASPSASATGSQVKPAPDGTKCAFCGADVSGKRFCTECGGKAGS